MDGSRSSIEAKRAAPAPGGVAVLALALLSLAPAPPCGAAAPRAGTGANSASHGGPLPDSLLARVGTRRDVSLAGFHRAWGTITPPQRPDSLTPESARKFLDLLIDKEVLGEAALRESWVWTARESAEVLGLQDRLTLGAVLDSALRATQVRLAARGDTIRDLELLGTVTRDSTVARLAPAFDTTLTRRLAAAWAAIPKPSPDSSLMSQLRAMGTMPVVAAGDQRRVLAHSTDGDILVRELLASWMALSPTVRPRVSTPAQIEDLARNALFERLLRRDAERRELKHRPDIATAVQRQREYIAVSHLVARDVYATLVPDSASLLRYHSTHPGDFDLPMRIRLLRLDLPDRSAASRMALELRDRAHADSLIARGRRKHVQYLSEITRESDSLLFDRALAAVPGSVLGPDSTSEGWTVIRVMEVVAPRSRTFAESRPLVEHAWYGEEGERRMVELIAKLRRHTSVEINDRALARLLAEGLGAPGTGAPRLTPAPASR